MWVSTTLHDAYKGLWADATKRLSIDDRGRVVYRYKRPLRDGSMHVVLETLDFMFRMNGMPRTQGCAGAAFVRLADFDARGPPGSVIVA